MSPGYSGGNFPDPSYEDVCTGITGHAEVAQVTYDPEKVSYMFIPKEVYKLKPLLNLIVLSIFQNN